MGACSSRLVQDDDCSGPEPASDGLSGTITLNKNYTGSVGLKIGAEWKLTGSHKGKENVWTWIVTSLDGVEQPAATEALVSPCQVVLQGTNSFGTTMKPVELTITGATVRGRYRKSSDEYKDWHDCNGTFEASPPLPPSLAPEIPYGTINAETLGVLGHDLADRTFDAVDKDGDGRITRQELSEYLMARDFWLQEAAVAQLFTAADAKSDGFVDREELHAVFNQAAAAGKPWPLWLMALAPPPAGVGVFSGLVRRDGPIAIPDAALRAMTLRQLRAVGKHARTRCDAEGWLGVRFDGGKHYERLKPADINLYDVATHVILPATHGHVLRGSKIRPSFVELVAAGAQRPDYFCSHYWGEPIADFVDCIAQSTRDLAYGGGKFITRHDGSPPMQKPADGLDARVWVCAYANRQWDLDGDLTDDPRQTSFARAMRLASGTIAVVDAAGQYFSRVWCCFEIFNSLQMKEEERDVKARANGPYKYHIYTKRTHNAGGLGERRAVGLVDGDAPADAGYADNPGTRCRNQMPMKAEREAHFPKALLRLALGARVEDGEASVAADRKRILNCIVGGGRDLNAEAPPSHERYDDVNSILHGRVAADALRAALEEGGVMLEAALAALQASSVKRVSVYLQESKAATIEGQERIAAALPVTVEDLTLIGCLTLRTAPRLAELTQLKALNLFNCASLTELPDLSKLTKLETLNLAFCRSLSAMPKLPKKVKVTKPSHLASKWAARAEIRV